MRIFGSPKQAGRPVTEGRFELERDGHVGFLNYAYDGEVLELIHTEVPETLKGLGVGSELAHAALEWAREHHARVDILCPFVENYVKKHPEYSDLRVR
jgi:uncharacterized protein